MEPLGFLVVVSNSCWTDYFNDLKLSIPIQILDLQVGFPMQRYHVAEVERAVCKLLDQELPIVVVFLVRALLPSYAGNFADIMQRKNVSVFAIKSSYDPRGFIEFPTSFKDCIIVNDASEKTLIELGIVRLIGTIHDLKESL